jgi:hypothetical protein
MQLHLFCKSEGPLSFILLSAVPNWFKHESRRFANRSAQFIDAYSLWCWGCMGKPLLPHPTLKYDSTDSCWNDSGVLL